MSLAPPSNLPDTVALSESSQHRDLSTIRMIHPYEDRYRRVYAAGARFWETPLPTEELVEFIKKAGIPRGSKVIEFGCGEGRDAIFLAKTGLDVTAVDIAPSAVERAREWAAEEGVQVNFQVKDVREMKGIPGEYYDLGIDIGCLQMFPEHQARRRYFAEAFRVLKPKAIYFLCNHAVLRKRDLEQQFGKEWVQPRAGELRPRRIVVDGEEKEIPLPVIAGHGFTKKTLTRELQEAGFRII